MKISRNFLFEQYVRLSHVSNEIFVEKLTSLGHQVSACKHPDAGSDDTVFDFKPAKHRSDCRCILGLARESAAAFGIYTNFPEPVIESNSEESIFDLLDAEVFAEELCNRYSARMITNVHLAPSPKWMRDILLLNDIRPVNNIVDITNFVALEYGQPVHAFDYGIIQSGVVIVRQAQDGEILTDPSGNTYPLTGDMLVTCDALTPVGLTGVTICEDHGISDETVTVVFEAANCAGSSCGQAAQLPGLTDLPTVDPMLTVPALNRVCQLVKLLKAGDVLDGIIDVLNYIPEPKIIPLECDKLNRQLGMALSNETMIKALSLLDIKTEDGIMYIPSFRPDLNGTEDIAQELARLSRCIDFSSMDH